MAMARGVVPFSDTPKYHVKLGLYYIYMYIYISNYIYTIYIYVYIHTKYIIYIRNIYIISHEISLYHWLFLVGDLPFFLWDFSQVRDPSSSLPLRWTSESGMTNDQSPRPKKQLAECCGLPMFDRICCPHPYWCLVGNEGMIHNN